jgi:hypothetical protein
MEAVHSLIQFKSAESKLTEKLEISEAKLVSLEQQLKGYIKNYKQELDQKGNTQETAEIGERILRCFKSCELIKDLFETVSIQDQFLLTKDEEGLSEQIKKCNRNIT